MFISLGFLKFFFLEKDGYYFLMFSVCFGNILKNSISSMENRKAYLAQMLLLT